jgi:hypothetical protein
MKAASSNSDGLSNDAARVKDAPRFRILLVEDDVELIELLRTSLNAGHCARARSAHRRPDRHGR